LRGAKTEKMTDLVSLAELNSYFDNEAFVLKTQQQIAKDFATYHLHFSDNFKNIALPKDEIESRIAEQLTILMKEGETRLLQLLYTIDLPEKEFLALATQPDFLARISERILLREAYKVYLRMRFSK
jgi:hypothetical protein